MIRNHPLKLHHFFVFPVPPADLHTWKHLFMVSSDLTCVASHGSKEQGLENYFIHRVNSLLCVEECHLPWLVVSRKRSKSTDQNLVLTNAMGQQDNEAWQGHLAVCVTSLQQLVPCSLPSASGCWNVHPTFSYAFSSFFKTSLPFFPLKSKEWQITRRVKWPLRRGNTWLQLEKKPGSPRVKEQPMTPHSSL